MSNLRVMLPSGTVASVDYVKPVAEKILNFNGRRRRLIEYASDMKKRGKRGMRFSEVWTEIRHYE